MKSHRQVLRYLTCLLRALRWGELLVDDAAGGECVPALVDAALVDGEEGDEPGRLEGEDGGDGHGAREAERLQAWQNLEGTELQLLLLLLCCSVTQVSSPTRFVTLYGAF